MLKNTWILFVLTINININSLNGLFRPNQQQRQKINRFPSENSRLDVYFNIGLTLTQGETKYDLGTTSSQMSSEEDICNILKMTHSKSNGNMRDTNEGKTTYIILESLIQRLCFDMNNKDHIYEEISSSHGSITRTKHDALLPFNDRANIASHTAVQYDENYVYPFEMMKDTEERQLGKSESYSINRANIASQTAVQLDKNSTYPFEMITDTGERQTEKRELQSMDTADIFSLAQYEIYHDQGSCFSKYETEFPEMRFTTLECWVKCQTLDGNQFLARHQDDGVCKCYLLHECQCMLSEEKGLSKMLVPQGFSFPEKCSFDEGYNMETLYTDHNSADLLAHNTFQGKACKNDTCKCDLKPLLFDSNSVLLYALFFSLSTSETLLDFNSPQYQAACWITFDDPLTVGVTSQSQLQIVQRYILAVLYFSTNMSLEPIAFLSSESECKWAGVTCQGKNNATITQINLHKMSLTGTIPVEISHLRHLVAFDLNGNKIMGTIPEEFGLLSSLRFLNLKSNLISGQIPRKLLDATELNFLSLAENELDGTLPENIGNAMNLRFFSVGNNKLRGAIPNGLWNLSMLESLWLGMNDFSSTLDTSIGELKSIKHLWIESCNVEGPIPSQIGLLSNLDTLDLRDNMLAGTIPPSLGNLPHLKSLHLQQNYLSGNMPHTVCENSVKRVEADCFNRYFDPAVNCACCTKCTDSSNVWNGKCPDTKIEVFFTTIYAYRSDIHEYVDVHWNITNMEGDIVLGDSTNFGLNMMYTTCVASTECFKFHASSGYFDDFAIDFSIKIGDETIFTKALDENKLEYSYEENLLFGQSSRHLSAVDECHPLENICEENITSSYIPIYSQAVRSSGKKIVDDPSSLQNHVTCSLARETNFNVDTITQRYVISLFHDLQTADNNECEWEGIVCDAKSQVVSINMSGKYLDTQLLSELGQLPYLRELNLSNSGLHGSIPESFSNLWSLVYLDLSYNYLSGTIGFDFPHNLEYVDLSNNNLKGSVPSQIGAVLQLKKLRLQYNQLTIPPAFEFFSNSKLEEIDISANFLKGSLDSLSNFEQLEKFDMSNNLLTGNLPAELLSIPSMKYVNVSKNAFKKGIPAFVGNHSNMEKLDLSRNILSGQIPTTISTMKNLQVVKLQGNKLTGTLPQDLGDLKQLKIMSFSHNSIKGRIPQTLQNITGIIVAHFHDNKFEGRAPEISSAQYITDCGFPSSVQVPVVCETCTVCCNAGSSCQKTPTKARYGLIGKTLIYLGFLYSFIWLAYVVKGGMSRNRMQSWEDIDMVDAVGNDTVYMFFLSCNYRAYVIAIVCSAFQMAVLFLFINAVRIKVRGNDWEYTMTCPPYQFTCIDDKVTTTAGYLAFGFVMAAWIVRDLISSFKLLVHAIVKKTYDGLLTATVLFGITFLTVYTSVLYNRAIATTNTELIVNAVILLFVTDLDEKVFEIARVVNPVWVDVVTTEVLHRCNNLGGKGMLATFTTAAKSRVFRFTSVKTCNDKTGDSGTRQHNHSFDKEGCF